MQSADDRMAASEARTVDALTRCRLKAKQLCEAMDEATAPHGIRIVGLDEDDSMVTTVEAMRNGAAAIAGK